MGSNGDRDVRELGGIWRVWARCGGLALVAALAGAQACRADDSLDRGAFVFDGNCADCHPTTPGGSGKKGPTLFGIVGRAAGQISGFSYSDANRNSKLVFDGATLDKYLTSPSDVVPGTIMRFPGLPIDQERQDLIEFLTTLK
jgi:cytochrome c